MNIRCTRVGPRTFPRNPENAGNPDIIYFVCNGAQQFPVITNNNSITGGGDRRREEGEGKER